MNEITVDHLEFKMYIWEEINILLNVIINMLLFFSSEHDTKFTNIEIKCVTIKRLDQKSEILSYST